jgi:primosomal protein N' (replication factor Y) (superfamily II helicase)
MTLHRSFLAAGAVLPSVVPSFLLLLQCPMMTSHAVSSRTEMDPLYADVIVPRHLTGPFTYRVPVSLKAVLRVGHLVLVPFGRSVIQGAVISLTGVRPSALAPEQLKEIRTLVTNGHPTEIPPHLLQLARRVAEAYVAPWGQCLRLVMPPTGFVQIATSRVFLTQEGREALAAGKAIASSDALDLLRRLKKRPLGIKGVTLRGDNNQGRGPLLASLVKQGWIHEVHEPAVHSDQIPRIPSKQPDRDLYSAETRSTDSISSYPKEWNNRIVEAIVKREATRLLIQAPTQQRLALLRYAIGRTVANGRTVLVIVGEAERAESIATAISESDTIVTACLHSGLPQKQKADIWEQIRQWRVHVVVGTRSSVFLPIQSPGLIWIEREEDPALKEPQEPRYHAREVAWLRAQDEHALMVLGSAHLSLETIVGVGHQERLQQEPVSPGQKPTVEVVDLRAQDRGTILSPLLVEAMRDTLARKAGVLLFLNRKGYAGALICRDCGQAPSCPSCHVAFAYYRQNGSLRCSYCGMTTSIPDLCPFCTGPRLQVIGEGTERVEEQVRRIFPQATVLRMDGETMRKPKQAAEMWRRIQQRQWDVLVGTQVVLRDDRIPPVGLVGVVSADVGLSFPDFRAAERTVHLLADAAGLAQPSSCGGRVIVQTYLPSHHTVQAVLQQDDSIFKSEELSHRTALGYPPAVHLFVLHVSGKDEKMVEEAAWSWVARLSPSLAKTRVSGRAAGHGTGTVEVNGLTILGPVPSPIPKLRGRYRRQILVKSRSRGTALHAVQTTVLELEKDYPSRMAKFDVDVDPLEMW